MVRNNLEYLGAEQVTNLRIITKICRRLEESLGC